MTAFREGGSRFFYVEHACLNATGVSPGQEHVVDNRIGNPSYMVRMFFIGDLNAAERMGRVRPEEFEYVTDMMPFPGKNSSGYTNCPICGSRGQVKVDEERMVPIYEEMTIPITE